MNKGKIEKNFTDRSDIEKINLFTRRTLSEEEVYTFTIRLCDNEVDRDFERFSLDTLNSLCALFTGKTGIFDHSMKSGDQKARIYCAWVEKQEGEKTECGDDLYCLKAKAYMLRSEGNAELIEEIEAGIKKEVSVSCSVEKSICSVCGKDTRRERCSHIAGNRYNGKLCYRTLEGAKDAYEFSFVAVPAQREAGVTKAFTDKEDVNLNEVINTVKGCEGDLALSKKEAKELSSYIEGLEENARLSEEYKDELKKEVARQLMKSLPDIDREIVSSVTAVMTFKELKGFKDYFSKSRKAPQPQLMNDKKAAEKKNYSHFRI